MIEKTDPQKIMEFLEKNKKYAIALTVLIAIQIFAFSSIVFGKGGSSSSLNVAVFYHFIIFFLFSFFLSISISGGKSLEKKDLAIIFAISIVYAISDEVHQLFVPTREFSISDILTNNAGILSSMITYAFIKKKSSNNL